MGYRSRFLLASVAAVLTLHGSADGAIQLRSYLVEATANAVADGSDIDEPFDQEMPIGRTNESEINAYNAARSGSVHTVAATAQSGALIASATGHAAISAFNPDADQLSIIMSGSARGSRPTLNASGNSNGIGSAQTAIQFEVDKDYNFVLSATITDNDPGNELSRLSWLATGDGRPVLSGILVPGVLYTLGGTASGTGALGGIISPIGSFEVFLSLSATGAIGEHQAAPVPPTVISDGIFTFEDALTGHWVDPPLTDGYRYTMMGDSLFTDILEFPTGFDDTFEVYVGGSLLGIFGPGQVDGNSVDFTEFGYADGVSEFLVRGINPLVDVENPAGFPLRLAYSTPTADFVMTADPTPTGGAVPTPGGLTTWTVLGLAFSGMHLLRRPNRLRISTVS